MFLGRRDDWERPQALGDPDTLFVFEVTVPPGGFAGESGRANQGRAMEGEQIGGGIGRSASGPEDWTIVQYTFGEEGADAARQIASYSEAEVRARLEEQSGYNDFDEAGGRITADLVRSLGQESSPFKPEVLERDKSGRPIRRAPLPSTEKRAQGANAPRHDWAAWAALDGPKDERNQVPHTRGGAEKS
jgi:hypothetical protein